MRERSGKFESKIRRFDLSRDALEQVSPEERQLLFSLCHLANELNMLHKLSLWTTRSNFNSQNEAIRSGQVAQALFLLRMTVGKLHEGHKLLKSHYWGKENISRPYNEYFSEKGRDAVKEINQHWKKSRLLEEVRNNFAFHYSPDRLDATFKKLPRDEDLTLYGSTMASNTLRLDEEELPHFESVEIPFFTTDPRQSP